MSKRAAALGALLGVLLPVTVTAQKVRALSLADLETFTFELGDHSSVVGGRVPLEAGRWKDPGDSADGGSTFTLLPVHAIGDLDGDGAADAAVVLIEATAGTGTFYYLFAVKSQGGKPVQLGPPEWLGDRSSVERLSIDRRGVLTVRYVTHKDGDPSCCPTLRIDDRYRVQDGRLAGITK
ncbi:MAG: hypothetical protein ACT4QD_04210 [Acidobacteriota bacterium]